MTRGFDLPLEEFLRPLEFVNTYHESGSVKKIQGPIIEGNLIGAAVGNVVTIAGPNKTEIEGEVVGFHEKTALIMPLGPVEGIPMGARIEQRYSSPFVECGPWMLGKLLDGQGRPSMMDGVAGEIPLSERRPVKAPALPPTQRRSIHERLVTGVRSIDSTIPIGLGQRIAVMAGSGVGKSMLMGMIARNSQADINVIALVGERGREVTEFLERDLGPEGMKRSIVIAVTSDESPVLRVRGAYTATAIAEYFRDQGKNVMLIMDSVTRFAMALREIGLSSGEPPTTKGYTPSVFNQMPKLLERAGAKKGKGSITGVYTVLVEGDDFDDPIADTVRSIVDGHVVLTRALATKNHYPSISVLQSVSRLTGAVTDERERELNNEIRKILSTYQSAEDLINIGGYRKGTNPEWDRAIELYPKVIKFLKQAPLEVANYSDVRDQLEEIFRG